MATAAVTSSSGGVSVTVVDGSTFDFAATFPSQTTLTDGSYTEADAAPGFGAEYTVGTGAASGAYLLCSDNCNNAQGQAVPAQGTFDLSISSPGASQGAGGATLWSAPQGTLSIFMPAQSGGNVAGTVTVNVTL
jgi:hypothetical protein